MSVRGLTPQVKTYRLMDDGYPPEKTPSKECQTCGRRQAEHEPGGHGLKDLPQGTRNQHRRREGSELGGGRWPTFFYLNTCTLDRSLKCNCSVRLGKFFCKVIWLLFAIEKLLIFVLYLAFNSTSSLCCSNKNKMHWSYLISGSPWFILAAWQIRCVHDYKVFSTTRKNSLK